MNPIIFLFLIIVFFSGLYVYSTKKIDTLFSNSREGMQSSSSCPTLLIKQGNAIILYNPKEPQSVSNPLPFFNLQEYTNYLEQQRKNGIHCPILYLQQENDTQGNDVYRIRPNPFDVQGGLPYVPNLVNNIPQQMVNPIPIMDADRAFPPYNQGNYPGVDAMGLFVGQYTELDRIHDSTSTQPISANPLDTNWGGVQYTQKLIDSGVYNDNNVYPPHLRSTRII